MKKLYPWRQVAADLALQNDWSDKSPTSVCIGGKIIEVESPEVALATRLAHALRDGQILPFKEDGLPLAGHLSVALSDIVVAPQQINPWLASCGLPLYWAPEAGAAQPSRSKMQEEAIIDYIDSLGFHPLKLPKSRGKAGVKSKVKTLCRGNPRLFTDSSFTKTWQRLRDYGVIGDAL